MKRITFLFLTITFFQSFIASQEFMDFLKQESDETISQFLINCQYSLDRSQNTEQNTQYYERLLTLSPFTLPDLLETELPQKEVMPERHLANEREEENASPTEQTTFQEKFFKFECLETTRQGTICKKWFSKSSLYSHLKKHHSNTCYNQEIPIETRCCKKIKHFKWKTLIAKHCLLIENKGSLNEKCSYVKNIITDQVGHALTLK